LSEVRNVHSVRLRVPPARAGALLDTLGSDADVLWPRGKWPAMRIEGGLRVGAPGRHGPVHYTVEEYVPSTRVRFRFSRPVGFVGTHTFEVFPEPEGCRLEHRVEIIPSGLSRLGWPLVFGPLHDALAEDAVDNAVRALGETREPNRWSTYVRLLRGLGSVLGR
jgi:hypothetical protein